MRAWTLSSYERILCVPKYVYQKKIVHKFTLHIYVFWCERGEVDPEPIDGRRPGDEPTIPFGTLSTSLVMAATCTSLIRYYRMQTTHNLKILVKCKCP
jgi:hypothetical protein